MTKCHADEIILAVDAAPAVDVDLISRLPRLIGQAEHLGGRLQKLRAGLVGCGSVGARIADHLVRLHVAELLICDRGAFKKESLLTQPVGPDAIGRPKASFIGRRCKQVHPATKVRAFDGAFQDLDSLELADLDVVFMATDNLAVELKVGQATMNLGRPLIHASVEGQTLVAQVRTFGNQSGDSPCPADAFGREEWQHLHAETAFKCELGPDGKPVSDSVLQPTASVPFLCSIAADLALVQMFRHLFLLGQPVADTMLEYSGFTHRTVVSTLRRNPECPCDHQVWQRRPHSRPLTASSLRELGELAEIDKPAFMLDGLAFLESAVCACETKIAIRRFVDSADDLGTCPRCGGRLHPDAFRTHRSVSAKTLGHAAERPLRDIGAGAARWLVVRNDEHAALFREVEAMR